MIQSFLLALFKNFPPELSTLLIATSPIGELRLAIPIALKYYELTVSSAYFYSVMGNTIPAILILKYLKPVSQYLYKKSKFFHKFFVWLFDRTRKRFNHHYDKYGMVALILFVAVPLPMTGAWTAAIAAWLFELPKKKSLGYIVFGILIAGVVVSLVSLGVFSAF